MPTKVLVNLFQRRTILAVAFYGLYTESYDVAVKQGIDLVKLVGVLDPEFLAVRNRDDIERIAPVLEFMGKPEQYGNMRSSMLQDMERGRRTEIDYLNGYIVKKGLEAGVPTPINEAIVSGVKEVEAGKREIAPKNLEEIWNRWGGTVLP